MTNPVAVVRQLPAAAWVGLVALVGVAFLVWHRYDSDDQDTDWHNPKNVDQPPSAVDFPVKPAVPGAHGCPGPARVGGAFRSRAFPGSLADAHFSIIGEI